MKYLALRRLRRSARLLVFALALPAPSYAAESVPPPSAQTPPPSASAQTEYRRAHAEMNQGNWARAREILLALWQKAPTYDVAASLAETEAALGEHALAAEHLLFAIEHVAPKEEPETVERYRQALERERQKLGSVAVEVNQSAAEISVDGRVVGTSPLRGELYLAPGTHRIAVTLGTSSAQKQVEVTAGTKHHIMFELALAAKVPPASANSAPTSPEAPPPPQAPHAAAARASGTSAKPIAIIGGAALTAILLGSGIAGTIRAKNAQEDVDRLRTQARDELGRNCSVNSPNATCQELADAAGRRNRANELKTLGFVAGGAALVGTVVLAFLLPSRRPEADQRASLFVSLTPNNSSIGLRGSF